MRFGAVHWCRVAPAPPTTGERAERLSAEDRAHAQTAHDAALAVWGKSVRVILCVEFCGVEVWVGTTLLHHCIER